MKRLLTFFFFCQFSASPDSSSTCASDKRNSNRQNSRQPLEFINVTVIGLNKGGVTNAEGHFTIEQVPPGIYRLQATAIGYKSALRLNISCPPGIKYLDRDGREPDGARRHYCHCFPFSA